MAVDMRETRIFAKLSWIVSCTKLSFALSLLLFYCGLISRNFLLLLCLLFAYFLI